MVVIDIIMIMAVQQEVQMVYSTAAANRVQVNTRADWVP